MKSQKDLLNDLIDAIESEGQEADTDTSDLEDNQVVGENGEIIELDY
jgi:hypothetical protein